MPTARGWLRPLARAGLLVLAVAMAFTIHDRSRLRAEPPAPATGAAASARRPAADARARLETALKVGQDAPDFELHRLSDFEAGEGGAPKANVSEQTVRLSSFRGSRPVCLIFSSYT